MRRLRALFRLKRVFQIRKQGLECWIGNRFETSARAQFLDRVDGGRIDGLIGVRGTTFCGSPAKNLSASGSRLGPWCAQPEGNRGQSKFRKPGGNPIEDSRLAELEQLDPSRMLGLDQEDTVLYVRNMGMGCKLFTDKKFPTGKELGVAATAPQFLFIKKGRKNLTGRFDA